MRGQYKSILSLLQTSLWHLLGIGTLVLLIGGVAYWTYWSLSKTDPWAFAGKVIEKRLNRYDGNYGGGLKPILVLEDERGGRTAVVVNEQLYAQARIGKWVVRDPSGMRMYDTNPQAVKK